VEEGWWIRGQFFVALLFFSQAEEVHLFSLFSCIFSSRPFVYVWEFAPPFHTDLVHLFSGSFFFSSKDQKFPFVFGLFRNISNPFFSCFLFENYLRSLPFLLLL